MVRWHYASMTIFIPSGTAVPARQSRAANDDLITTSEYTSAGNRHHVNALGGSLWSWEQAKT